jgi:acyl-CoA thioester hydrolase
VSEPFRLLIRVRYNECDMQGIVFNARWGDYADLASAEYMRALFGSVDPAETGLDWRLVKQTTEWWAPARYDDVLDLRVRTLRVGTTSFVLATEYRRHADQELLASTETTCVMVEPSGAKMPISADARAALEHGAPGVVVDHAAAPNRD